MKKVFTNILFSVLFSTICLAQWTQVPTSPPGWFQNIIIVNDTLYVSHISDGVYKSTDSMLSWQLISNGLNNSQAKQVQEVLFSNGNLFAATVDGIYKSTNAGTLWNKSSNGITIGPGALYEFCESVFEYNGNLFTGAWNGIYRSSDEAANWVLTNVSGQGINAKNFTVHNGALFAARENINFPSGYKSIDNGLTWNALTSMSFPTITFFSEPPALWAGTIHGAWLSTDNGISWVSKSTGLSPDPYNSSFVRVDGQLITSLKFGGSGMFRSSDEGLNWENWGEGLPFLNSIEKLIVFKDEIIAATSNSLWQRDTSEVVSTIGDESLPQEFILLQNYPNPFNPKTIIGFGISDFVFVTLKVYNLLGEEVAVLVNEHKPAGSYEVEFDAAELTSGIYFYNIQAGSFVKTEKMILLR